MNAPIRGLDALCSVLFDASLIASSGFMKVPSSLLMAYELSSVIHMPYGLMSYVQFF